MNIAKIKELLLQQKINLKNYNSYIQTLGIVLIIILASYLFAQFTPNKEEPLSTNLQATNSTQIAQKDIPNPKLQKKNIDQDPLVDLKAQVEHQETNNLNQLELDTAAKILNFANNTQESITSGWLAQADIIVFFIRVYLGEWELAFLPKVHETKDLAKQRLLPPNGLFSNETTLYLADNLDKMLDNLDLMLKNYNDLAKYVLDENIQDEGVFGKKIAHKILDFYAKFKDARQNYFGVIDEESKSAEDLFLQDEPLRRQIIAARYIFGIFQEVAWAQKTRELAKKLALVIDYAAAPPFRGKPLAEMHYRLFLKNATLYHATLTLGNEEGFYPETRQKLNDHLYICRSAYNEFAQMMNRE